MTTIWQDGFDTYSNTSDLLFRYSASQPQLSTTAGRFGGGCYQATQNNSWLAAPCLGNPSSVWVGFAFQPAENTNLYDLLGFTSTATPECVLAYDWTTSTFKLFNTQNAVAIALSGTVILNASEWSWIDVFFSLNASAGECQVFVNNTQCMNATGLDTVPNAGVTTLSLVSLSGSTSPSGQGVNHAHFGNYDDFCIRDTSGSINNGRQGDSRITTGTVNSDATPNDGTPSTSGAPHYTMVNEVHWNAANSLTLTNTSGQIEAFGITPLSVVPAEIIGVQLVAYTQKSDAGDATFSLNAKSSGTLGTGATQNPTQTYAAYIENFSVDPHTGAAWTATAVDDMIVQYEVQAP